MTSTPVLPNDAFWVIEGQLLAGPYPGAPTRDAATAKLTAFLDLGVRTFVDLTEAGEGPPLRAYAPLLRQLAERRACDVTHVRLPIRDVGTPTVAHMKSILAAIHDAVAAGRLVYVHCWGGVGRTGTVIGCLLIDRGVPSADVLGRLAALRRTTERAHRPAPETAAQRRFVHAWRRAADGDDGPA